MSTTEIAPGWYPDALAQGHIRYWDGTGWTSHTAAPLSNAAAGPGGTPYSLPVTPRAPRRRPPLPAFFVAATVLIGFPLAITIGVLAAHASAPPPLETIAPAGDPVAADSPAPSEDPALPENAADAAAKTDAAALRLAITRYYQQTWGATPPVLTVSDGEYVFAPVPYGGKTWTWPPFDVSDGVSLGGQNGDSMDSWCVWVRAYEGSVNDWQATDGGVSAGTCGLG